MAIRIKNCHAKAPGVGHLFDVHYSIQARLVQPVQVGIKDGIDEDDQDRSGQGFARQPQGVGLAQQLLLLDVAGREGIAAGLIVFLDLVAELADDEGQLVHWTSRPASLSRMWPSIGLPATLSSGLGLD